MQFDPCVADLLCVVGRSLCCRSFLFTPMLWVPYILIPVLRISLYVGGSMQFDLYIADLPCVVDLFSLPLCCGYSTFWSLSCGSPLTTTLLTPCLNAQTSPRAIKLNPIDLLLLNVLGVTTTITPLAVVPTLYSSLLMCCGSIPVLRIFSLYPYVVGTIHFDPCVANLPLCWGYHTFWSLCCWSPLVLGVLCILIPMLRISSLYPCVVGTIHFDPSVADLPLCWGIIHFDPCVADLLLCWGYHAFWSLCYGSPLVLGVPCISEEPVMC